MTPRCSSSMIEMKLDAALAIVTFAANFIGIIFYQKSGKARHCQFVFQNLGFGRPLGWKFHECPPVTKLHIQIKFVKACDDANFALGQSQG